MKVFVVVAYRYGGNENVFPIGVFATRGEAEAAARCHRQKRGGKYSHQVTEFEVGVWHDRGKARGGEMIEAKKCALPLDSPKRIP